MMGLRALAALFLALGLAMPAAADQNDRRLDGLFERLQSTQNQAEAAQIQNRIWRLWFQAADEDVNLLMRIGSIAMNRGEYEAALGAFDRIIDMAPDFAEGWNRRATLYY
ncbi:MAG: hypothetical protein ACE5JZ_07745, partial [Kiloniellales bacterium]